MKEHGGLWGCKELDMTKCLRHSVHVCGAGVQPQQDPGGTLRMNGVGERRHVRPALIGSSLRGREREGERETRRGVQQSLARFGNALFFTVAFIP